MKESLAQKPLIGLKTVPDHRAADSDLLAAMSRPANCNAPACKLVQEILDCYTINTEGHFGLPGPSTVPSNALSPVFPVSVRESENREKI
jgi:hypothetical protein